MNHLFALGACLPWVTAAACAASAAAPPTPPRPDLRSAAPNVAPANALTPARAVQFRRISDLRFSPGFADQSHMTRTIAATGPGALRRAMRS